MPVERFCPAKGTGSRRRESIAGWAVCTLSARRAYGGGMRSRQKQLKACERRSTLMLTRARRKLPTCAYYRPNWWNLASGVRVMCKLAACVTLVFVLWCRPIAGARTQDSGPKTKTTEIRFTSHDGYEMFGKLVLPASAGNHPVVIYVQTAEGSTVDMKRRKAGGGTFNYYDLYREKLPEMNVGFFSYEGRGITGGDQPPRFEKIDRDIYNTSTLDNKVRDILSALRVVQKQPGVDASRIFLMGASE